MVYCIAIDRHALLLAATSSAGGGGGGAARRGRVPPLEVTGFCPDVIADVTLGCDWPLNFARM